MKIPVLTFLTAVLIPLNFAFGQSIRAVLANPPGNPDDGFEYVELAGTANTAIPGLWFLVIDGDNTNSGTIDVAINLSTVAFGSNGLILLRDGPTPFVPAPAPGTNVQNLLAPSSLENGSATYLLVINFTGSIGDDLDTNDDGVLNAGLPWSSVRAAIGKIDNNGSNNNAYATEFGGMEIGPFGYNPDFIFVENNILKGGDVTGETPGPFAVSLTQATDPGDFGRALTPGATGGPLPVVLTRFEALPTAAGQVELIWSTASEQNNSHFSVERSADGRSFSEIGTVRGAGNSGAGQKYTFLDERPLQGANYYRLRQVDFDGQFSYSPLRSAYVGRKGSISVAPSPASDRVVIRLEEATVENGDWQVFDAIGRVVQSGVWSAENDRLNLEVADLPPGTYTFCLTIGRQTQVKQFSKQ